MSVRTTAPATTGTATAPTINPAAIKSVLPVKKKEAAPLQQPKEQVFVTDDDYRFMSAHQYATSDKPTRERVHALLNQSAQAAENRVKGLDAKMLKDFPNYKEFLHSKNPEQDYLNYIEAKIQTNQEWGFADAAHTLYVNKLTGDYVKFLDYYREKQKYDHRTQHIRKYIKDLDLYYAHHSHDSVTTKTNPETGETAIVKAPKGPARAIFKNPVQIKGNPKYFLNNNWHEWKSQQEAPPGIQPLLSRMLSDYNDRHSGIMGPAVHMYYEDDPKFIASNGNFPGLLILDQHRTDNVVYYMHISTATKSYDIPYEVHGVAGHQYADAGWSIEENYQRDRLVKYFGNQFIDFIHGVFNVFTFGITSAASIVYHGQQIMDDTTFYVLNKTIDITLNQILRLDVNSSEFVPSAKSIVNKYVYPLLVGYGSQYVPVQAIQGARQAQQQLIQAMRIVPDLGQGAVAAVTAAWDYGAVAASFLQSAISTPLGQKLSNSIDTSLLSKNTTKQIVKQALDSGILDKVIGKGFGFISDTIAKSVGVERNKFRRMAYHMTRFFLEHNKIKKYTKKKKVSKRDGQRQHLRDVGGGVRRQEYKNSSSTHKKKTNFKQRFKKFNKTY